MTKYSGNIQNLLQGVSQQPERERRPEQLGSQNNCMAFVTKGLGKRPGSYFIKDLGDAALFDSHSMYMYDRGDRNEAYVFSVGDGVIKIWDLFTGAAKTVTTPDGVGYLAATDPQSAFKFHTVADTTFVVNQEIEVTSDTATDGTDDWEVMIYCKQANWGKTYKVIIDGTSVASYTTPSTVTLAVSSTEQDIDKRNTLDTTDIIDELHTGLSSWATTNGVTYTRVGDVIWMKKASASYSVRVEDGNNGNDLKYVRDTINNYNDLPKTARHAFKVKITGVDRSDANDYYVEFNADNGSGTGTGVWEECAGFNVEQNLTASTMPHKVVRQADGSFVFEEISWVSRSAGDDDSNPMPSFVGSTISDIITYQGRMVLTTEENQCGSVTFDFFNFFSTSVIQESDDDPIDTASSDTQVTDLHHTIVFNSSLVSFSDSAQFFHPGETAFTSKTFSLASKAKYPANPDTKPVTAAQNIFLPFDYGEFSGVRELFFDGLTGNFQAESTTDHVRQYIEGSITQLAATAGHNKLFVRSDNDTKKLYVYEWYTRENSKLQSAWSTWEFTGDILFIGLIRNYLYILETKETWDAAVTDKVHLMRIDVSDEDSTGLNYPLRLDSMELADGSAEAGYWEIPTEITGLTNYEDIVVVAGANTGFPGRVLDHTIEGDDVAGYEVHIDSEIILSSYVDYWVEPDYIESGYGETPDAKFWVGLPYTSDGVLTNPYIRDAEGNPVTSDKLRLNYLTFNLGETGSITFNVTKGNQTFTKTYNARIIDRVGLDLSDPPDLESAAIRVGVRSDRNRCDIEFSSDSHLPFYILDIDWMGDFSAKGRRN